MIINYPYRTQQVRDLAWACFSPALLHVEQVACEAVGITGCAPLLDAERRDWLLNLDRDASALLAHLSLHPTHRLGLYFEQLWHFFLRQDPTTDLIAHNLAVVDQGRTIGEFDCIYYDHRRQRHVHLELAVKYFLGMQRNAIADPSGNASDWVGPNSQDRLDKKLAKLLQHQIFLGNHPAAARQLLELGIGPVEREVALKGYLFQPVCAPLPLPPGYNHDNALCHWVRCDQLQAYCTSLATHEFLILPRLRWLCAARCDDARETFNPVQLHVQVLRHFEASGYPLLIAALDENHTESTRFFVTPEPWPPPENRPNTTDNAQPSR